MIMNLKSANCTSGDVTHENRLRRRTVKVRKFKPSSYQMRSSLLLAKIINLTRLILHPANNAYEAQAYGV